MSKLEVFESAMCCPTGVCGVSVDPVLVQFNADLQWLTEQGVEVSRHSLSHDAAAFAGAVGMLRRASAVVVVGTRSTAPATIVAGMSRIGAEGSPRIWSMPCGMKTARPSRAGSK